MPPRATLFKVSFVAAAAVLLLSGCASTAKPKLLPVRPIWGKLGRERPRLPAQPVSGTFVGHAPQEAPSALETAVCNLVLHKMLPIAVEKFRTLPYSPLPQTEIALRVSYDAASGFKLVSADHSLPPVATTLAMEAFSEACKALTLSEEQAAVLHQFTRVGFIFG